jgi:ornithine carbamoyltransferase
VSPDFIYLIPRLSIERWRFFIFEDVAMAVRHFLTLLDFSPTELMSVLTRAIELKKMRANGVIYEPFKGKVLAMIFEKSSTRTRVSFEAGMAQFGGSAIFLSPRDTQLGRGEPVEDSARVISRMTDIVMIRTFAHDIIERFAAHSRVPVINGLTDDHHPCQILADLQTFLEHRGTLQGKTFAWIGDGNNMCNSYIHAAHQLGFQLKIACPYGFEPDPALLDQYKHCATLVKTAEDAAQGAHLIATDVWTSMGQEAEQSIRKRRFSTYQVNPRLMDFASPDALFMHCLPAHRGEEISEDMLDDPRAVVWDEAENRLHAQKALMEFLLTN